MIIKGDKILGLKIISIDTGKEIDTISDIIYDPKLNKVRGFVVSEGGWFKDAQVLLIENVKNIGADAVMVQSENVIRTPDQVQDRVMSIAEHGHNLTKTKVITEDGTQLGIITDILFDSDSGQVEEFEVSQGLVENVKSGKKRFKIDDIMTVGEESTIVRGYTEIMMEGQGQTGGLQGALNQAKDKAGQLVETAKEKGSELKDKAEQQALAAKYNAQEAYASDGVQDAKNQIVDKFHQAKETLTEKKDELQQKVESGELKHDAKQTASSVAANVQHVASQAADKTKSAYQDVKQSATEQKDNAMQQIDDKRKQEALGKYVTTNIISRDDLMLATRGEMITHELLEAAQVNGVLQNVLDNTSQEPLV